MCKILAFGASSSRQSINKKLAVHTTSHFKHAEVEIIDLNDFEMPIFGVDKEKEGIPALAYAFKEKFRNVDGIIISFAEHNGSYSTAFKNIFDWSSRIEKSMWLGKPMLLLATSPGQRGGQKVLEQAAYRFPFMDGKVIATFSLPSFNDNFNQEDGITNDELRQEFLKQVEIFKEALSK